MKAWKIAAGILCCLVLASGCGMGQHPYYDCGPVWSQGACPNCDPDYRAGSILNRHGPGVLTGEEAPRAIEPAPPTNEPAGRAAQPARVTLQGPESQDRDGS